MPLSCRGAGTAFSQLSTAGMFSGDPSSKLPTTWDIEWIQRLFVARLVWASKAVSWLESLGGVQPISVSGWNSLRSWVMRYWPCMDLAPKKRNKHVWTCLPPEFSLSGTCPVQTGEKYLPLQVLTPKTSSGIGHCGVVNQSNGFLVWHLWSHTWPTNIEENPHCPSHWYWYVWTTQP